MNENSVEKVVCGYCNTHAQNTSEEVLTSCVDWVRVNCVEDSESSDLLTRLGLNLEYFTELENSNYGFKKCHEYNGIKLYRKGKTEGVICLELTGAGCRFYESLDCFISWQDFFLTVGMYNPAYRRIDIAIDDYKSYFQLTTIEKYLSKGWVRSRFAEYQTLKKGLTNTGEVTGRTVYLGNRKSRVFVRMYDKRLQLIGKYQKSETTKELINDLPAQWNRTEIEFKNERADEVADVICNTNDLNIFILGVLRNYIIFIKPSKTDTNKARWKMAKFWEQFLHGVEKVKLATQDLEFNMERSKRWFDKQVNPTLALLHIANNFDSTFNLDSLIADGLDRFDDKHYIMLNKLLATKGHNLSQQDFNDLVYFTKMNMNKEGHI